MPVLYLVGTPIGNLQDISPRALAILKSVALIAAEDTRTARQLLSHFDIHTPLTSYYEHSQLSKLDRILDALATGDVAVVSEAGMPGINDPGHDLVHAAIARGYRVSPVPGPSAVLAALVASGLAAGAFYFLGFLPREPQARRKLLRQVRSEPLTLVCFETPHRLCAALKDLHDVLGDRPMCAAREMTKLFEEFRRGTIGEIRAYFDANAPRGEFTLIIAGASAGEGRPAGAPKGRTVGARRPASAEGVWDDVRALKELRKLLKAGVPRTEAVKRVARLAGRDRREVYELSLRESR